MAKERDLTRRANLGLIGALGATVALGHDASASDGPAGNGASDEAIRGVHGLVLPHTATTAVDVVASHSAAELTNDLNTILATISSWDQNYAILVPNPDGTLQLRSAFTAAEIQQLYTTQTTTSRNPGGERRNSEINGRWYDFLDSRYNVIRLPSGTEVTDLRGAFLIIAWPDGVVGEIFWGQPSWAPAFDAATPPRLIRMLVAYEDAWRSGDVDARLTLIEDETCSVVRVARTSGDHRSRYVARTKDELRAAWTSSKKDRILGFERLQQVVSTFYVFAAYRLVLDVGGEKVVRETAALFPLGPSGKFIGELSYSLETKL